MPTQIRFDTEQAVDGDPVFVSNLGHVEISDVVKKLLDSQVGRLPQPESMTEIYKRGSLVILRATKRRSWKQLAKDCTVYMITWRKEEIIISISQLDKQGRFDFPNKFQSKYSPQSSLSDIIQIILDDYQIRHKTVT